MDTSFSLRLATPADRPAVDALLARSYPVLLAPDYPAAVLAGALPIIACARPELLASSRYFVVADPQGVVLGAGGYSLAPPGPRQGPVPAVQAGVAHVRHVVTDPGATRRGIAGAILARAMAAAGAEGAAQMECLSTITAVPFYTAMGFAVQGAVDLTLAPGVVFGAVQMSRSLP